MHTQSMPHQSINRAAKFLKENDKRLVRITLADVAEPVTVGIISCDIDTVYAGTPTGDNVEFLVKDVRMVTFVPVDPVGPDKRDTIAMEEAREFAAISEVQRILGREYQRIATPDVDATLAEEAEDGETPEQTFVRQSLYNQMLNAWQPFVERKEWVNRVLPAFGVKVE